MSQEIRETQREAPEPPKVQLTDRTGQLTLIFQWQRDRYVHRIQADASRLQSVDGDSSTAWPDSPPLQQLSLENIGDSDVVLGVGCAGTSHWSISVEPLEQGFRFDWACKTKETPEQLGSAYELSGGFRITAGADAAPKETTDRVALHPAVELDGAQTYRWSYSVLLDDK